MDEIRGNDKTIANEINANFIFSDKATVLELHQALGGKLIGHSPGFYPRESPLR
jgi:hypothetical protein